MGAQLLSCGRLFVTPMDAAHQACLSMEFSMQEYWGESPFPSPKHVYIHIQRQRHVHIGVQYIRMQVLSVADF